MGLKVSKWTQDSVLFSISKYLCFFKLCWRSSHGSLLYSRIYFGEFVDWTMCPVLRGITRCFLGRCSEELKFLKGLHTMHSNKNYEDVKSGLAPCCNNVKGRCQLGRNGFKNLDEPVVADENQISEAFAHSSCWLCPWDIDVWSAYDSAPELFQLSVWPKVNWRCSHLVLVFIPACWN